MCLAQCPRLWLNLAGLGQSQKLEEMCKNIIEWYFPQNVFQLLVICGLGFLEIEILKEFSYMKFAQSSLEITWTSNICSILCQKTTQLCGKECPFFFFFQLSSHTLCPLDLVLRETVKKYSVFIFCEALMDSM